MRVSLINAPFLPRFSRAQRSPGVIKSNVLYYPYWLAHAAALLDHDGFEVDLFDAVAEGADQAGAVNRTIEYAPRLALIETSTPSIDADLAFARRLKRESPSTAVFLVGTHVSALPEETLTGAEIDGALLGEYDETALDLARALQDQTALESVAGLALSTSSGVWRTAARPLIDDLDRLPWIAPLYKHSLPIRAYNFSLAHHPMVMLISGRGCLNNCFFCLYPQVMHGRRYRARSPEHLVGEVEWIAREMREVREIVFEDDTFTADEDRAVRFAELKRQRGIAMPFFANLRVNTRPETMRELVAAGLRSCAVGFESADECALRDMRKGITLERARSFMREAHAIGLLVHGCFMVGFPDETTESMERTLKYAIELEPDSAQFYPVFPYPGTEAFRWADQQGYLRHRDWRRWLTPAGGHAAVVDLPAASATAQWEFCERAFRRFHFRPRYIWRKLGQAIRWPSEGWRSVRGLAAYLDYLARRRP